MAKQEIATLGGGCFWCLEAVFDEMKGVLSVESGYAGGALPDPSYEAVCSGTTGHAEVVRIAFDADVLTYAELLEVFFAIHDPTSLNRQGNDVGTQYRSVVFYHSEEQRQIAEECIRGLGPGVVTEVSAAPPFYVAEDYHQEYFANHPFQSYCLFVVGPKVKKFREKFGERRK
ncbi:MAG: peptide-methionine (S)-S-oxide reductase MsrA [Bryobacterales bacterium]|nr:peptide-methionine (S)-S-oxide reductase MsrA [Bryobacterales bacterium]